MATVQLVFDAAGGPAASLRWDDLVAYDDRFGSELERDIAEQLGGRGYSEGGLNVVGYHEGYPVWSALPRAEDPSGFCLVYYVPGEDAAASCSDLEAGITEPALIIPDPEAGTVAHMVLTVSEHAFPYLTITIRPLEVAQVDPDTGDELPGFDDTTGDPSP